MAGAQANASITVTYTGFTPEARAAFQFAVDIWATQVSSPVPIRVDAEFVDLGPGILGFSGPLSLWYDVPGGLPDSLYPEALANHLAGWDVGPEWPDVEALFSSTTFWYFGTDGRGPFGSYDFVSVALHELGHGLGVFGSARVASNGQGRWGYTGLPVIYDQFVVNGAGQSIVDTAVFPNPSTALAAQLTGNNLFFSGPQTRAANGGAAARLYAPSTFAGGDTLWGSSYTHLDETTYGYGNPNSLMTPFLSRGEVIHDPGAIVHGMLRDMGWVIDTSSCAYSVSRTPPSFTTSGGSGSVTVSTTTGCPWSVSTDAAWITVSSNFSGARSGVVTFSVLPNFSSVPRTATIRAAGQSLTVTQAGVPCTYTLGAAAGLVTFPAAGGSVPVPITASAPDCVWTAAANAPWLSVAVSGPGSGAAIVMAQPSSATTRVASVTVQGSSVPVRQNGHATTTFDISHDGAADVLAYNPATGARFFASGNPRTLGFSTGTSATWAAGWSVFPGDFNADGRGDLFFYNPATGRAIKAIAVGAEAFAYTEFTWSPGWQVTIADLNGDGADDAFVYNTGSGQWYRCISQPDGSFTFPNSGTWSPNWSIYTGDFNADGRDDLFLYNATSDANRGRTYRVLSNADESLTYIAGEFPWSTGWTITPGDYDGDGRTDLFLYGPAGNWYRVDFRPSGTTYEGGVWSTGWTLSRGDFNGDGRSDLFVYNTVTGRWYVVISEAGGALSYYGGLVWSAGWQVHVTDINVDGVSDLILYNPTDGRWFQAVTQSPGVFAFANGSWATGLQITAARPQVQ